MLKIARLNGCITVSLLQWWETAKKSVDCYCQNGYFLYDVEYKLKPKARKTYKTSLRQKDIIVISQ